jgi:hypothetical protein
MASLLHLNLLVRMFLDQSRDNLCIHMSSMSSCSRLRCCAVMFGDAEAELKMCERRIEAMNLEWEMREKLEWPGCEDDAEELCEDYMKEKMAGDWVEK